MNILPRFNLQKGREKKEKTKQILFICTANFYRSRFAEAMFNHYATEAGLAWRALSKGLYPDAAGGNISSHVTYALGRRGVPLSHTAETASALSRKDLRAAQRVIALKGGEHRSMMRAAFPEWVNRIEYWDTDDLDFVSPEEGLPRLEEKIRKLVDELSRNSSHLFAKN